MEVLFHMKTHPDLLKESNATKESEQKISNELSFPSDPIPCFFTHIEIISNNKQLQDILFSTFNKT